jgi:hypothetical protein
MSAMIQMTVRTGIGMNQTSKHCGLRNPPRQQVVRGLRSQSREVWAALAMRDYPAQQEAGPVSPERSA